MTTLHRPPEAVAPSRGVSADFIDSPEFASLTLDDVSELPAGTSLYADREAGEFADLSAHGIDSIGSLPVLSPAGEQFLFRKMNYLKYRARRQHDEPLGSAEEPSAAQLLAGADAVRRHLAECNLRLVASIARRFAADQRDFDELVSEGNLILLKAVDRFDYSRGFRFSTYLTYSVQRHLFRLTGARSHRRALEIAAPAETLEGAAVVSISDEDELAVPLNRMEELVRRMDECLTEREQWVVRERFGLGQRNSGRAFREIAEEAGLSKERVRQIQLAALRKLKDFLLRLEGERAETAIA